MSTVGYGDYGPKTVLGRLFVFVIILGGIVVFSQGECFSKVLQEGKRPIKGGKETQSLTLWGGIVVFSQGECLSKVKSSLGGA